MLTLRGWGRRLGPSIRFIRVWRRSASSMMIRVYSRKPRVRQFGLQELGGPAQPAQGILDLMGQAADQGLGRLVLGQQLFLAGDAQLLIDLMELHEQFVARVEVVQGQDGAVDRDGATVRQADVEFALGEGVAGAQGRAQPLLDVLPRAGDQVAGALPDDVPGTDVEQHLPGGVDVDQAEIVVEQQHRGVEVVE